MIKRLSLNDVTSHKGSKRMRTIDVLGRTKHPRAPSEQEHRPTHGSIASSSRAKAGKHEHHLRGLRSTATHARKHHKHQPARVGANKEHYVRQPDKAASKKENHERKQNLVASQRSHRKWFPGGLGEVWGLGRGG